MKHVDSYDPWLELDAATFQHNVREVARLAGGRPVMAVIKNNAYGLGDEVVGPAIVLGFPDRQAFVVAHQRLFRGDVRPP